MQRQDNSEQGTRQEYQHEIPPAAERTGHFEALSFPAYRPPSREEQVQVKKELLANLLEQGIDFLRNIFSTEFCLKYRVLHMQFYLVHVCVQ